ncbi:MAG: hypothetical protein Q8K82_00590 [Gemmatimonadaceae bacterium]|nr:hypothetical protein [Gemmatimonadaceae bacterium]
MKQTTLAVLAAAALLCSADAQAQYRGDGGLTVTVGRHSVRGGFIHYPNGIMLDVLAARRVRTMHGWSMVAAGGIGVIWCGSTMDVCRIGPDGACAPKGNFVAFDALVGVAKPIGRVRARVLAGPALYNGAEDKSLGVQARLDLSAPASSHHGLGGMLRATWLPSHGGDRLTMWAAGGTLSFR